MKIASFDIGIKNMAYCVFDYSGGDAMHPAILDWNVVNLGDACKNVKNCNQRTKQNAVCNSKAKYYIGEQNFCLKHAKMTDYLTPKKEYLPSHIKKMKKDDLCEYARKLGFSPPDHLSKDRLVEFVMEELTKKLLL